jgi:hypothetical protein
MCLRDVQILQNELTSVVQPSPATRLGHPGNNAQSLQYRDL